MKEIPWYKNEFLVTMLISLCIFPPYLLYKLYVWAKQEAEMTVNE